GEAGAERADAGVQFAEADGEPFGGLVEGPEGAAEASAFVGELPGAAVEALAPGGELAQRRLQRRRLAAEPREFFALGAEHRREHRGLVGGGGIAGVAPRLLFEARGEFVRPLQSLAGEVGEQAGETEREVVGTGRGDPLAVGEALRPGGEATERLRGL